MEIRRMLWGESASPAPARPAKGGEKRSAAVSRPSADRLELSRQWVENMEEQRARAQAVLLTGAKEEKKTGGILDMLDEPSGEEEELDALSEQLKIQQKCLEIAMRMMKGKKVPPQDERYLMENDLEGYKIAMAMKAFVKEDKEECESVLDDEDKKGGESSGTEEAAPAEGGEVSSGEESPTADSGEE